MIYISNWHTTYSELLSKVFKNAIVFRKWDLDQRDFPKNFKKMSIFFILFKIKKGDTLISNKAIYDLPIIFLAILKKINIKVVLHGEISRASKGIKLKIKRKFYNFLCKILPSKEKSFISIQNAVRKSYGFKNSHVIQPYVELKEKSIINLNRSVLVANNISRAHFNKDFLNYVHQNIAPLTVIGRDNAVMKESYSFNFVVPDCKNEFFNELNKGGIAVNCLMPPEASYNLGLLDCIAVGMPIISIYRQDLFFKDGSFTLNNNSKSLQEIKKNLNNKDLIENKIKILRDKAKEEFNFNKFANNWLDAIK